MDRIQHIILIILKLIAKFSGPRPAESSTPLSDNLLNYLFINYWPPNIVISPLPQPFRIFFPSITDKEYSQNRKETKLAIFDSLDPIFSLSIFTSTWLSLGFSEFQSLFFPFNCKRTSFFLKVPEKKVKNFRLFFLYRLLGSSALWVLNHFIG